VLADLVRTDRQHHRPIAGDSEQAEAVKVLARAHQNVCWMRGRQASALRSTLREFYPGALAAFEDLTPPDALAVLGVAPTPAAGRRLSRAKIASALRRSGRQRNVENRAEQIQKALRAPQLEASLGQHPAAEILLSLGPPTAHMKACRSTAPDQPADQAPPPDRPPRCTWAEVRKRRRGGVSPT
jgi:hypothetical protein